jgi:hypothetical protein
MWYRRVLLGVLMASALTLVLLPLCLPTAHADAPATTRVSVHSDGTQANGHSYDPSTSADGRYVAFESYATNLVVNDTNGWGDIFVHDRQTGTTSRISVDSSGTQGNDDSYHPSISADGRFVAFHSYATSLVTGDTNGSWDVFVHDRQTGTTARVSVHSAGTQCNGDSYYPSISADGRFVAFYSEATNLVTGDTYGVRDIFVRRVRDWAVHLPLTLRGQ